MGTVTELGRDAAKKLYDLIEINIDSGKGFETAARATDSERLASLFWECAAERRAFAHELKQFLRRNGERRESGSALGAAHRWWLAVRSALQEGDEHAVLAEAERGEDVIKKRYEEILDEADGLPLHDALRRQYAAVKARHDLIRDLRDQRV